MNSRTAENWCTGKCHISRFCWNTSRSTTKIPKSLETIFQKTCLELTQTSWPFTWVRFSRALTTSQQTVSRSSCFNTPYKVLFLLTSFSGSLRLKKNMNPPNTKIKRTSLIPNSRKSSSMLICRRESMQKESVKKFWCKWPFLRWIYGTSLTLSSILSQRSAPSLNPKFPNLKRSK